MNNFDPHLIKWIIIGLVFLGRAVVANNRKRKAKNEALRAPQSAGSPTPIASSMQTRTQQAPAQQQTAPLKPISDSPWSSTKGPFD